MTLPPAIAAVAPDGQLTPVMRRRILTDIARRRIRPGTGSAPEFLRRRTALNPWPDLRPVLIGIPWAVVGGVATRAYMPERATEDLAILVRLQDEAEVQARLVAAGYKISSRLAVHRAACHHECPRPAWRTSRRAEFGTFFAGWSEAISAAV